MDGKILMEEAARIVKRSLRSVYRMVAKVREKGPEGVLEGNRNKVSPRRVSEAARKKVIEASSERRASFQAKGQAAQVPQPPGAQGGLWDDVAG